MRSLVLRLEVSAFEYDSITSFERNLSVDPGERDHLRPIGPTVTIHGQLAEHLVINPVVPLAGIEVAQLLNRAQISFDLHTGGVGLDACEEWTRKFIDG